MFRYVHTNIIAKEPDKLIDFYKTVFHCKSINEKRDLSGEWLDRLTGLNGAHIILYLPILKIVQKSLPPAWSH